MNKKIINNSRICPKGDIEANWNKAVGFVPFDKEIIIYKADEIHPKARFKVGDGKTVVQELPFSGANMEAIEKLIDEKGELLIEYVDNAVAEAVEQLNSEIPTNLKNGHGTDSLVQVYTGEIDGTHYGNTTTGDSSVAFGEANQNSAQRALICGKLNSNDGANALVSGLSNTNKETGALMSGYKNINRGPNSTVGGRENKNYSEASSVIGSGNTNGVESNTNESYGSNVYGGGNTNTAKYTSIGGSGNTNDGSSAIVGGQNNNNTGGRTIVGGMGNTNGGHDTIVVGKGLKNRHENLAVFGKYNDNKSVNLLEIGNGKDAEHPSNSFEVLKDGRAKVYGEPKDPEDVVRLGELVEIAERQQKEIDGKVTIATFNITKVNTVITLQNLDDMTQIDWGDGTVDSVLSHTYAAVGEYVCKIYDATRLGNSLFWRCTSLTNVVIGNSVTSIGYEAFYYCDSLTSVVIPDSVTSIGDAAFSGCDKLVEIYYNAIDCADCNSGVFALAGKNSSGVKVTIGKNVVKIPTYLFGYGSTDVGDINLLPNITSVIFEEGSVCKSIGNFAFCNNENFTNIIIPNSVISIGDYAFRGCRGLTEITIPDKVTSIGVYAFQRCIGLINVIIGDSVASIGDRAFASCLNLENVAINNSLTTIGADAFNNCDKLTRIIIPDSVTNIGQGAFKGCAILANAIFKKSLPLDYDSTWFNNCSSLTHIYVPYGCRQTYIDKWAEDEASQDILDKIVESDREAMISEVNTVNNRLTEEKTALWSEVDKQKEWIQGQQKSVENVNTRISNLTSGLDTKSVNICVPAFNGEKLINSRLCFGTNYVGWLTNVGARTGYAMSESGVYELSLDNVDGNGTAKPLGTKKYDFKKIVENTNRIGELVNTVALHQTKIDTLKTDSETCQKNLADTTSMAVTNQADINILKDAAIQFLFNNGRSGENELMYEYTVTKPGLYIIHSASSTDDINIYVGNSVADADVPNSKLLILLVPENRDGQRCMCLYSHGLLSFSSEPFAWNWNNVHTIKSNAGFRLWSVTYLGEQ